MQSRAWFILQGMIKKENVEKILCVASAVIARRNCLDRQIGIGRDGDAHFTRFGDNLARARVGSPLIGTHREREREREVR